MEYLTATAPATWGAGTAAAATWLATTRAELGTGTPVGVLGRLRALAEPVPAEAVTKALRLLARTTGASIVQSRRAVAWRTHVDPPLID